MNLVRLLMVFVAMTWGAQVSASSLFVDPAYPREGWTFDNQNDITGATWYTYNAQQQSTWAIAAMQVTYVQEGAEVLARFEGDINEITSRTGHVPRGRVTMVRRFRGGVPVYEVQGQGFSRRLTPYLFGYGSPLDQFHGLWVGTLLDPASLGELESRTVGFVFTGNATVSGMPVRTFVNPTTGTHGVLAFNTAANRFEGFLFPFDDAPTRVFYVVGDDNRLAGEMVSIDDLGNPIAETQGILVVTGVANTDASGQALLQRLTGITSPAGPQKVSLELDHLFTPEFLKNSRTALDLLQIQ